MLRTKGEAGTGNVVEAVRHQRALQADIRRLSSMKEDELFVAAKEMQAPYELVKEVATTGRLPVVNFAAGGKASSRLSTDTLCSCFCRHSASYLTNTSLIPFHFTQLFNFSMQASPLPRTPLS